MESKKINQLATELTPSLADLTIIGDPSTGISKKITLSQMAALFTGTVEEYPSFSSFPVVGVADTIYIATDTNVLYRWNTGTSAYVELSPNIIASLVFNDSNGFDGTISLVGSTATLTITTTLTSGSVAFGGASGALSQDNSNFYWDNTNKRHGINTNTPTTTLDVFGSGIIGRFNGTSTNNAFLGFASNGMNRWSIGNVQSDHRFRIYNEATTSELATILSTGEFGIGIANPTTKFHIDGAASALIVNLDANVSIAKSISFRSDNSNRWNIEVSGTESTGNAGMDFFLRSYSDAGALIETPLSIVRSTGVTTIKSLTLTNALSAANGGTGITSYTIGDLIYASGSTTLAKLADVATGNALISGGVGVAPSWGKIDLTTTITGTLPVANGGTGATTFTAGRVLFGNGTSAINTSANLFWDNTNSRLGIGTDVPAARLQIVGAFAEQIRFGTNTSVYTNISMGTGFTTFDSIGGDSGAYSFRDDGQTRLFINASGFVGIGTDNPTARLHVANSLGGSVVFIQSTATNGEAQVTIQGRNSSGTSREAIFKYDNTDVFRIATASNIGMQFETNDIPRLRISNIGNIGVGVVPATWVSTAKAIQVGGYNSLSQQHNGSMNLVQDAFENASNSFAYGSTGGLPTRINMNPNDGAITFFNAAAGTSGNTITWNQRMQLDSSGRLVFTPASISDANNSIFANSNGYQYLQGGTNGLILSNNSGQDCRIRIEDNNTMIFETSSTQRMRFTSGGAKVLNNSVYTLSKTITGTANGTDVIFTINYGFPGGVAGTIEVFAMAGIPSGGSISSRLLTFNFAGGNNFGGTVHASNVSNSVLGSVAAPAPAGTSIDNLSASITSASVNGFNISISNTISGSQITAPTYYIKVTYGLHSNATLS